MRRRQRTQCTAYVVVTALWPAKPSAKETYQENPQTGEELNIVG